MAATASAKRRKTTDLADKVSRYLNAKKSGRRGYERADRLLNEIAAQVKPGEEVPLGESGKTIVLVDKFAEGNIVWTPCAARRWELKIIEP